MLASRGAKQLSNIASSWPVDPFRPNIQLKNFLNFLSVHPKLTPDAVQAAQLLRDNAIQKKVRTTACVLNHNSRTAYALPDAVCTVD